MSVSYALAENYVKLKDDFSEDFPFSIGVTNGIHKSSLCLHCHDSIEICYIRQGSGKYMINNKHYFFKKGDIFVINSNEMHFAYDAHDVVMLVMLFNMGLICSGSCYPFELEYLKPFWSSKGFDYKLDAEISSCYNSVLEIIQETERVFAAKDNYYKLIIKQLLLNLSLTLMKYLKTGDDSQSKVAAQNNYNFQPVFDYVDRNYSQKISLRDLASIINMSISNFCATFKKVVSISPMEYVIRVRIMKSAQLLVETDLKVSDLAERCGFVTMSHFLECFKRYTGLVPTDFRKLGRNY